MPDFSLEDAVRARAKDPELRVVGLDEVGMGCLAGPIFVGAVVLDRENPREWHGRLNDSKRVRVRAREELYERIVDEAVAWATGWTSNTEIDEVGLSTAQRRAFMRAFEGVAVEGVPTAAVVDDQRLAWLRAEFGQASLFVNRADSRSLSVAAASIIAKVTRDRFMWLQATTFGGYGFERNVGYPTQQHLAALEKLGPCSLHRRSFEPVRQALAQRSG